MAPKLGNRLLTFASLKTGLSTAPTSDPIHNIEPEVKPSIFDKFLKWKRRNGQASPQHEGNRPRATAQIRSLAQAEVSACLK